MLDFIFLRFFLYTFIYSWLTVLLPLPLLAPTILQLVVCVLKRQHILGNCPWWNKTIELKHLWRHKYWRCQAISTKKYQRNLELNYSNHGIQSPCIALTTASTPSEAVSFFLLEKKQQFFDSMSVNPNLIIRVVVTKPPRRNAMHIHMNE